MNVGAGCRSIQAKLPTEPAKHLALFGSAARDELRADSDVYVLVDFDGLTAYSNPEHGSMSNGI